MGSSFVLFERPKKRAFKYKPIFYKLPEEQEDEESKTRIKFDRFPRTRFGKKSIIWYVALLGMVIYMMHILSQYK